MPLRPVSGTATDHGAILVFALLIPLAALCLCVVDVERIAVRGWESAPLPHLCLLRRVWGISCPACGLTRGVIHLAHGRWSAALECHRLSFVVFGLILVQIPYRTWMLIRFRSGSRGPSPPARGAGPGMRRGMQGAVLMILTGLMVGNWCWELLRGR